MDTPMKNNYHLPREKHRRHRNFSPAGHYPFNDDTLVFRARWRCEDATVQRDGKCTDEKSGPKRLGGRGVFPISAPPPEREQNIEIVSRSRRDQYGLLDDQNSTKSSFECREACTDEGERRIRDRFYICFFILDALRDFGTIMGPSSLPLH
jgi:hypothetical protein